MNIYDTSKDNPFSVEEYDVAEDIGIGLVAKVILYDDDIHTFDEVITQLIKATACSRSQAEAKTLEVHTKGKSMVYEGELPECLRVSHILEEIALHTQIEM
ncbi:ATP-dependent Clp protease adaptor ClpS [Ignavibacteria bacterium]|nr:ATP-dependent Clp protease adaptor ClpS [Bacteroidota bacterium]MCZ2132992.1 ATP-dependent Clp protease adaptor ClpS [Bacteroidota bacterium]